MTLHQRILDAARRTRTTLYVITAVYVGIGFFLAVPAALSGDRLTAFLGFLIISGALAAAVVIGAVIRLTTRITAAGECIEEIRRRLGQMEHVIDAVAAGSAGSSRMIDLASFGKGDPSVLVAASLDRDAFPRLVTTMEAQPPASPDSAASEAARSVGTKAPVRPSEREPRRAAPRRDGSGREAGGVTTKNLLREWRVGLRDSDLDACRAVYAALVDTAAPQDLAPLESQLEELADRKERSLREVFTQCVRRRDYAGMLEVGEEIARFLPDRPIAAEFQRIRPHLKRRLEPDETSAIAPTLRVVR